MKLFNAGYAILAPALVSAAALSVPEPTQRFAVAADNWSPAPTPAPQFHILGREALQMNEGNTCGYVSGLSASPVSCPNTKDVCATNTYFGVHGCCDPAALSACTIATTCIPSSAMSSLCTDAACSSNNAVAKCTASGALECYKWLFKYESMTMTQHGCTAEGFTSTALRSYGVSSSSSTMTKVSESPMTSPTSSSPSSPEDVSSTGGGKKQSLAPIIGGTIGGCVIVSLVLLCAFLVHRRRSKSKTALPPPSSSFSPHSAPEFNPNGFPASAWAAHDSKTWQPGGGDGGGMHTGQPYLGISEVHGHDRAVEVEAQEKTKAGLWYAPGQAPVEVEAAPTQREGEKKRWWRPLPVVEAPT
ncbi:hypothetical protein SVAN01_00853 [Stagonosporopsis vannaccii]|nr:hypothetical protein SVAN01_00853 [Stagonosporopsis vannaccii]